MAKIHISLSANHATRMARLRQAEQMQQKGYKISQIVQVMSNPKFAEYFRNQFQAYLKGREDVLTTGDQHASDDAYLDVVTFLNSMLQETRPAKHVKIGDRKGIKLSTPENQNKRGGNRDGINYSTNTRNSRIGVTVKGFDT